MCGFMLCDTSQCQTTEMVLPVMGDAYIEPGCKKTVPQCEDTAGRLLYYCVEDPFLHQRSLRIWGILNVGCLTVILK